eukprot:762595-Lingulodinium_polyedra.AAC.1
MLAPRAAAPGNRRRQPRRPLGRSTPLQAGRPDPREPTAAANRPGSQQRRCGGRPLHPPRGAAAIQLARRGPPSGGAP